VSKSKKKNGQKIGQKEKKIVKKLSKKKKKFSESCQKVVKKLSKKLSKSCQKVVQKIVKKLQKVDKGSAMYHWSFYVTREAIKKKKSTQGVGGQIVVPRPSASASLTGRRQKRPQVRLGVK
jgi:flagellar biosynthesis/type III secretory pathway protein FliH